MTILRELLNLDYLATPGDGPAVDMRTPNGAGQIVFVNVNNNVGGGNTTTLVVNQGPTAAGPWTPLPLNLELTDVTEPGTSLMGYTRSMRFLQAVAGDMSTSTGGVVLLVVEPPPPLTLS